MPKKKPFPKSPASVAVNPHEGQHSPHILDLRSPHPHPLPQGERETETTFEEKVAAWDVRLKEMPNLVRNRAEDLSRLWGQQREHWQSLSSSWFEQLTNWGRQTQIQLAQIKKSRHRKLYHFPVLRFFQHGQLGLFLVALVLITIPLQGLFLYHTIAAKQRAIKGHFQGTLSHLQELTRQASAGDLKGVEQELQEALEEMGKLRRSGQRLGLLRRLLPERLEQAFTMLGRFERMGQDFLALSRYLTGRDSPRHILLLFQNPRELRPTGGFAGSLALLKIENGKLAAVDVPEGGTYDFQGQLPLRRISPAPLHLINPRLELQDANWWPDFPTSARKITQIYEAAGGPTIDAVAALTAYAAEDLLKIIGPLQGPDGKEFTAENFIDTLQETIATDRTRNRRTPKKIIAALFPAMGAQLSELLRSQPKTLATLLVTALNRKDLQVWSRDEKIQAVLRRFGATGELKRTAGDYLAVVTANVGGGKTDGVVEETITHEARLTARQTVETTVTIQRTHQGIKGDRILGQANVAYLRIYVPEGVHLTSAEGFSTPDPHDFEPPEVSLEPDPEIRAQEAQKAVHSPSGTEIWTEQDKTVFGNWLIVDPGETQVGTLRYEAPLPRSGSTVPYTLTIEQQAGKRARLASRVSLPPSLQLVWGEGAGRWQPQGWNFEGPLQGTLTASGVLYHL